MVQSSLFKLGSTVKRLCSFSSGFLSIQLFPFTCVEPSLMGTDHWQASLLSPFPQSRFRTAESHTRCVSRDSKERCHFCDFISKMLYCWVWVGSWFVHGTVFAFLWCCTSSHQRFHIIMVDTTAIVWVHCHRSIIARRSLTQMSLMVAGPKDEAAYGNQEALLLGNWCKEQQQTPEGSHPISTQLN